MNIDLYPLKLAPVPKEILWGGTRLSASYNKKAPFDRIAESWELTVRPDGMSVIENGAFAGTSLGEFFEKAGADAIAPGFDGDRFPLLLKLIDARDRLSIQVHPADDYALPHENELGKTEMWYILEADEGAEIIYGLSESFDRDKMRRALADGCAESLMNSIPVHAGDVFFIPPGLVHAIGSGILLAEIQQNSNVTYRIYDYQRRGADGSLRPLHIDKALDVIRDYSEEEILAIQFACDVEEDASSDLLAACNNFTARLLSVDGSHTVSAEGSFVSLLCVDGEGELVHASGTYPIRKGDSYFLPAASGETVIRGEGVRVFLSQL